MSEELLTAQDVDFQTHEKNVLASMAGRQPEKEAPAPEPAADEKKEPPAPAPAAETPKYLTAEDATRLVEEKLAAAKPKEEPKADPPPSLSDPKFETVEQWQEEYSKWSQRQIQAGIDAVLTKQQQEQQDKEKEAAISQQDLETKRVNWEKREAEAKTRIPDYDALKEAAQSRPFNETALQFILGSEVGPDLFAYYVRNEQEWNQLITLPPEDMRIELRVTQREIVKQLNAAKAQAEAPKPKTVSSAPPPPRTLSGRGAPADDPIEKAVKENDFKAYEAHYHAERQRDSRGRFA